VWGFFFWEKKGSPPPPREKCPHSYPSFLGKKKCPSFTKGETFCPFFSSDRKEKGGPISSGEGEVPRIAVRHRPKGRKGPPKPPKGETAPVPCGLNAARGGKKKKRNFCGERKNRGKLKNLWGKKRGNVSGGKKRKRLFDRICSQGKGKKGEGETGNSTTQKKKRPDSHLLAEKGLNPPKKRKGTSRGKATTDPLLKNRGGGRNLFTEKRRSSKVQKIETCLFGQTSWGKKKKRSFPSEGKKKGGKKVLLGGTHATTYLLRKKKKGGKGPARPKGDNERALPAKKKKFPSTSQRGNDAADGSKKGEEPPAKKKGGGGDGRHFATVGLQTKQLSLLAPGGEGTPT